MLFSFNKASCMRENITHYDYFRYVIFKITIKCYNVTMVKPNILVTGASGYIGGRLVDDLLKLDYPVFSMVRRPDQFKYQFQKT